MFFFLYLSCQINNSPPSDLIPKDISPTINFQRPEELGRIRIAAVGDILLSSDINIAADLVNLVNDEGLSVNNGGFDVLLSEIRPVLKSADITFANLASPVAPDNQIRINNWLLNGNPFLLSSLAKSGVDILSVANSHTFDQGKAGLRETIERIERNKIKPIGAGRNCVDAKQAKFIQQNNIKVAFLAASINFNKYIDSGVKHTCAFRIKTINDIAPFISNAKEKSDIVVVSIHWGKQYKTRPYEHIQQLAESIIEAGADIILGHHPLVLQPIEVYQAIDGRIGVIAYSLGSIFSSHGKHYQAFIQNDSQGNTRDSGILQLDIVKRNYGEDGVSTEINNVSFEPVWITHNPDDTTLPRFLPRLIDDQILTLNSEINLLESGNDRKYKKKEQEFLFLRRSHIAETIGTEWLTELLED